MPAIWLLLIGMAALIAGYVFYGGFLSRRLGIDPERETPAHTKRDGVDYVPAKPAVLLGHHFASIAGAAPIIGPVTAAVFGWLPVYVWIILGGIFMGAAHDFMSLVASIRHQGKSIGEVVEEQLGPTGKVLFLVFAWSALILVIAVFADVVATTFVKVPAVATASLCFIVLALAFGVAVNRFKVPLWIATVIGVLLLFGGLVLGNLAPLDLAGMLESSRGLAEADAFRAAKRIWLCVLFVYVFIASVTPVWVLLQPRDYLNSFLLYGMLILGLLGVLLYNPKVQFEMSTGLYNDKLGWLFPALFVTVACGAISGFHSLVASGTTAKQLDREPHAKLVGYGGMLIESLLAVLALLAVVTMTQAEYGAFFAPGGGGPVAAFSSGLGEFMTKLGIPKAAGISFVALAVSAFALTSLDTGTRLARFAFQEFFERRSTGKSNILARNRFIGTTISIVLAMALAFPEMTHPVTGATVSAWKVIWPIFGSANQLLASLALLAVSVWLARRAKANWFALAPMVFMFAVSMTSLVTLAAKNLGDGLNPLLGIVALVLFGLAYMLALQAVVTLWGVYRGGSPREASG
jgi:carbon starvation protein